MVDNDDRVRGSLNVGRTRIRAVYCSNQHKKYALPMQISPLRSSLKAYGISRAVTSTFPFLAPEHSKYMTKSVTGQQSA